jgi:hypothetical protein
MQIIRDSSINIAFVVVKNVTCVTINCFGRSARVLNTADHPMSRLVFGTWSEEDFRRAMHEGIGRGGVRLYPAMLYPAYTKVTPTCRRSGPICAPWSRCATRFSQTN